MRGLKRKDTPILKGYQIYHNYIREHEGLNGKTPDELWMKFKGDMKYVFAIMDLKRCNQL